MKAQCGKVSLHNKLVACGFAGLTSASAYHVGNSYGWNGDNPGLIDNFAIAFSVVGFAVALFCILSVPLNRVAWARLAAGAAFAAYGYLAYADRSSWGWVLFYGLAAICACWRIVEEGLEKEWERL